MVPYYTRRDMLVRAARLGVMFVGAPIIAACAAPAPAGSAGAVGETTWGRIKREGVARLGFSNEHPYSIAEPEKLTGADPEIVRAILAKNGVERLEGVLTEFSGLIPGLQAGRFDLIAAGMCIRPARCLEVAFSEPHFASGEGFAVKAGNPLDLHSYADLAARPTARGGVLQASVEEEYMNLYEVPQDRIVPFPEVPALFSSLQTGRIDAVALGGIQIHENLANLADPELERATPFEQPVDDNGRPLICFGAAGFRKTDSDFLQAYNTALGELKSSGQLLDIIEPFGFTDAELPPADMTTSSLCQE